MSEALALPEFTTPAALAKHLGCSERLVRDKARALNACRILGKRMVLTRTDIEVILEATRPCPSKSIGAGKSGTTAARLPDGDYEALRALRSRKPQHASRP